MAGLIIVVHEFTRDLTGDVGEAAGGRGVGTNCEKQDRLIPGPGDPGGSWHFLFPLTFLFLCLSFGVSNALSVLVWSLYASLWRI